MANLLYNDTVTRALSVAIASGHDALESVPSLLRRLLQNNMWQERIIPETGEKICFARFEDFVSAPAVEGLGTTMEVIRALCRREQDVLVLIDQATRKTLSNVGSPTKDSAERTDSPSDRGTSREYTVARLERDGFSDLAEMVINREITAAEARRQAGYELRKIAIRLDDPQSAAKTILSNMDVEAIEELLSILSEAIQQQV